MNLTFSCDCWLGGCKYVTKKELQQHPANYDECDPTHNGAFLLKEFKFEKGQVIKDKPGADENIISNTYKMGYFTFEGYRFGANSNSFLS